MKVMHTYDTLVLQYVQSASLKSRYAQPFAAPDAAIAAMYWPVSIAGVRVNKRLGLHPPRG